jgi:tRNA modification GTPase
VSARIACLTPAGSGAIAVIAIRGVDAWRIVQRLFRPASGKPLPTLPVEAATWFGRMGEGAGDEVILAVSSLQPEPTIEVHCHGGQQVVRWLINQLKSEGCWKVPPEQLVNGNDAWKLLPHAKTLRTAAILLDQANGAFDRAMVEIEKARADGRAVEADVLLDTIQRFESVGRHLIDPWRVAIAGAPNAGKSSLLNALAGFQRSVVAPIPGTTRDVVTVTLAFDGWPVQIADTAGLHAGGDDLEREGIERARQQLAEADLCLWVIDAAGVQPTSRESFAFENGIVAERVLPIVNKIDLPAAWDLSRLADAVRVSATTGQGIDSLIQRMVNALVPDPPPPGSAVPLVRAAHEGFDSA